MKGRKGSEGPAWQTVLFILGAIVLLLIIVVIRFFPDFYRNFSRQAWNANSALNHTCETYVPGILQRVCADASPGDGWQDVTSQDEWKDCTAKCWKNTKAGALV